MTSPRTDRTRNMRRPRLLEQVRIAIRRKHYSPRTEEVYVRWIRRFILHHGKRHPVEMGSEEVTAFLSSLAVERHVSASTQNQALSAILFLYQEVLGKRLPWLERIVRAKAAMRLPVVLDQSEVRAVLQRLQGPPRLIGTLLYGTGMRLLECCRLRVKDVDFGRNEIIVRAGKGNRDRRTMLPSAIRDDLERHLREVRAQHDADVAVGAGWIELPGALAQKYPGAGRSWPWQWVFPATRCYTDRATGQRRRHHLHESVMQRAMRIAVLEAGIPKRATCHSLRHYPERRIIPNPDLRSRSRAYLGR